jgi:hypothetical protein
LQIVVFEKQLNGLNLNVWWTCSVLVHEHVFVNEHEARARGFLDLLFFVPIDIAIAQG